MTDAIDIWEEPDVDEVYMLAGWRQWADAGSISSGLPLYLTKHTSARKIGEIRAGGFYLFQFPATHDLVRPVVKFKNGFPESLQTPQNEFYYSEIEGRGLVYLLGDEPHMDIERYVQSVLHAAKLLNVKRIVGFGGVYGEVPYNKERSVSSIYSLPEMHEEVRNLGVRLSDYHGGASIGSYLCHRAGEQEIEYVSLYAFVPTYDFSNIAQVANSIRIENDFMAWLGVMKRVNYMLKLNIDLSDLEKKSQRLIGLMDSKVEELDNATPQLNLREYLKGLTDEFHEVRFDPLEDVWEDELRRLFDKFEDGEEDIPL